MYEFLSLLAQINIAPLPHVNAGQPQIQNILTVVFTIIGALSVLFFVVGGLRYITAQGDPQQVSRAKSTLIYAIIGVLVSISAVSIVTFILGRV